jgi:hypothetical protein
VGCFEHGDELLQAGITYSRTEDIHINAVIPSALWVSLTHINKLRSWHELTKRSCFIVLTFDEAVHNVTSLRYEDRNSEASDTYSTPDSVGDASFYVNEPR